MNAPLNQLLSTPTALQVQGELNGAVQLQIQPCLQSPHHLLVQVHTGPASSQMQIEGGPGGSWRQLLLRVPPGYPDEAVTLLFPSAALLTETYQV